MITQNEEYIACAEYAAQQVLHQLKNRNLSQQKNANQKRLQIRCSSASSS